MAGNSGASHVPDSGTTPGNGPTRAGRDLALTAVRASGSKNRLVDRAERLLWFDARAHGNSGSALGERILRGGLFSGIAIRVAEATNWVDPVPPRMDVILDMTDGDPAQAIIMADSFSARRTSQDSGRVIMASTDAAHLDLAGAHGLATCLLRYVDDRDSLHQAIQDGIAHTHLVVAFRDPTNIPLELVIATLQATETVLVKHIAPGDIDDAVVTLGVMEVGADGVLLSLDSQAEYDALAARLGKRNAGSMIIEPATVVRCEPVGMGYRSCIDLATLFTQTEGMVVGSTSQGGILCCAEVFFLPYMELRPFRVNAGAVHSYVYNAGDRTDYMSELRAGSQVLVVDINGTSRRATVGRMKTEVRPLRLIEVEFAGGERVNVLMQDDWHVRIFSEAGTPLNITELKPGDRTLGHRARPGRHVGISVDEHIVEL